MLLNIKKWREKHEIHENLMIYIKMYKKWLNYA